MTLLNANREFLGEYEILCGTLALIYIFSPFYLRVMWAENKILYSTLYSIWIYVILQLYIERTEPPLN
jgi:phage shock protein PspC (stress-responsive transcriptional regulator)